MERVFLVMIDVRFRNGSLSRVSITLLTAAFIASPARATAVVEFGQCSADKHLAVIRLLQAIENRPYVGIRSTIIARGWMPAPASETSGWRSYDHDATPIPYNGQEQPFVDRKFFELESCAEDRDAPCIFVFQNKENDRLQISTHGKESHRSHAIVVSPALLACPPGKIPP